MKILLAAVLLSFSVCSYAESKWLMELEAFQAESFKCQETASWVFSAAVFRDEQFTPAETQEAMIEIDGADRRVIEDAIGTVFENSSLTPYQLAWRYMETCVRVKRERHK